MRTGERIRLGFIFGLMGLVPIFLAGWLGYLQVAQAGQLPRAGRSPLRLNTATAESQGRWIEQTPAPRGSIVARHGNPLAFDREAYEVRAVLRPAKKRRASASAFRGWLAEMTREFALALANDPELADRRAARVTYEERIWKQVVSKFKFSELPTDAAVVPDDHPWSADIRLAGGVDVLAVIDALRAIGSRRDLRGYVSVHFLPGFIRCYPDRELTHGIVGHTATEWHDSDAGGRALFTRGIVGLESASVLSAGIGAKRLVRRDGKGRPYFVTLGRELPPRPVVHSTIDLEMQRIAIDVLTSQAEAGAGEGKVTLPKWGALVLVEIESGDVLAAASWHRNVPNQKNASFTPYQSVFEPGSIVKPLVLGYAYESGTLDWHHVYDCRLDGRDYRQTISGLGRRKKVRDDHDCGDLSAHGILVNSSNIGATLIGLGLAREQWRDYMRYYGFGDPLNLSIPHGRRGGWVNSFNPKTRMRSFRANSAISFSFGYEFHVTALHIARAYMRLFRGHRAELRLCRGIELDGAWIEAPESRTSGKFSPRVTEAVRLAMTDVMSADPHATGSHVRRRIEKELGVDIYGLIAGKTGTAASLVGGVSIRNASFVGLMPAAAPRWLAVCVLQKDDSARFYGGSYAAPPTVRLLLQVKRLVEQRRQRQEPRPSDGQIR